MKRGFFAIALCLLGSFSFGQQSMTIALKVQDGYGPFNSGLMYTGPVAGDRPKANNIPTDIKEYVIRSIDFQGYNKEYKTAIEQYGLTKAQALEGLTGYDYDTSMLTTKDYRHSFNFLIGTNSKNQWVVIIDVNNNSSYSDDRVYTFEKLESPQEQSQVKLPSTILPFEFYDGNNIRKLPTKFYISPYRGNWNVNFIDTLENKYFLGIRIPHHQEGTITVQGKQYNVFVYNFCKGLSYTAADSRMMILPGGSPMFTQAQGNETFKIGDTLTVGGYQYRFSKASMFGDRVQLDYCGYTNRPVGTVENYYVPNVTANTVDGVPFNLSNYEGRYVLLDFWGTWCVPCVQVMPRIAALNEKYKDKNFVMVSVADDRDPATVKQFNERLKMNWINLFQQRGGTATDRNFINKFKISEFPTLILVDPQGKIVCRGKPVEEVDRILATATRKDTNAANTKSSK